MKRTLVAACGSLLAVGFAVGAAQSPHASETAASAVSVSAVSPAMHVAAADDVPFRRNDTLFFYERRQIVDGDTLTDRVFVDSDRASADRRRLRVRGSLTSAENSRDFAATLRYLRRKHPGPFPRHDLKGIPATWLPLVSVRGSLYIDALDFYPVHLTDSLFVKHTQDGP